MTKKSNSPKKAAKASAAKKAAKTSVPKKAAGSASKQAASKKEVSKKTAAKKVAPKKTSAKKVGPKNAEAKKVAPKRAVSKKAAVKKTVARKTVVRKRVAAKKLSLWGRVLRFFRNLSLGKLAVLLAVVAFATGWLANQDHVLEPPRLSLNRGLLLGSLELQIDKLESVDLSAVNENMSCDSKVSDKVMMVAQDVTTVGDLLYSGLKAAPEATQYLFFTVDANSQLQEDGRKVTASDEKHFRVSAALSKAVDANEAQEVIDLNYLLRAGQVAQFVFSADVEACVPSSEALNLDQVDQSGFSLHYMSGALGDRLEAGAVEKGLEILKVWRTNLFTSPEVSNLSVDMEPGFYWIYSDYSEIE